MKWWLKLQAVRSNRRNKEGLCVLTLNSKRSFRN